MASGKQLISQVSKEDILKLMYYNPEKGLIWKVRRGRFAFPGEIVGGKGLEKSQVRFNGTRVYVHHVVWFLHKGYWPRERDDWIDHKDGNHHNNLIGNLRAATPSQNNCNRRMEYDRGVKETNGKFRAGIQFENKKYFLGSFPTREEAAAAYQGASRVLHGEFSVFNRT